MQLQERVTLAREVQAIRIPDGSVFTLTAGSHVTITQSLGGTYTVLTEYGILARISDVDADALGKEISRAGILDNPEATIEEQVWARLKTCYDPEIPINIVELGLVYDCMISPSDEGGNIVQITMTLTAPGCGMGDVLAADIRQKLLSIRGVRHVTVDVVFDPPWDRSKISEAAQLQLGIL